jgi:ribosomal-protein-alanine N-acetyltransferase
MTSIRRMTPADLRAVSLLDKLSFNQPWPPNAFEIELENPGARCWVAEVDDLVVGALVLWRVLDEAELATLAVRPDFRRRGIARVLLQTALDSAYAEGARICQLEVRAGNEAAQKLYESFGFAVVGRRLRYYRDNGEDALLMTKVSE